MPTEDGTLTPAEELKVAKCLEKMKPECPACGMTGQRRLVNMLVSNAAIGPNNSIFVGGKILPSVPAICRNCGNTIFINGIVADIVQAKEEESHAGK